MEDLLGRILGLIFLGLIAITRFLSRTLVGLYKVVDIGYAKDWISLYYKTEEK